MIWCCRCFWFVIVVVTLPALPIVQIVRLCGSKIIPNGNRKIHQNNDHLIINQIYSINRTTFTSIKQLVLQDNCKFETMCSKISILYTPYEVIFLVMHNAHCTQNKNTKIWKNFIPKTDIQTKCRTFNWRKTFLFGILWNCVVDQMFLFLKLTAPVITRTIFIDAFHVRIVFQLVWCVFFLLLFVQC